MVPPWIVTCSCSWVSAAETLDELLVLVDLHKDHASAGRRHAIVVRGTVNLEHAAAGDFAELTRNGCSNKESAWFKPAKQSKQ